MSTLYSGIHLKLKSTKISLEDKIKLAHFAWISHQCFLPNKEQVILDWACHALIKHHAKKLSLQEDVELKLWNFLDSVLRSKRLKSLAKEGKSVKLNFAVAQVLNNFITLPPMQQSPPTGISTVLSCCKTIISTPSLAFVYTTKYELMVDLLSKLCILACHCLASEQTITLNILTVLDVCFTQYIQVQRQQSNPSRVFTHVVEELFQPCLLLRNALNSHVWNKNDDSHVHHQLLKDIRSNIELLLHSALFQPELLASYKEELEPEGDRSLKKKILHKILLTPVSSILAKLQDTGLCDPETLPSVIANSVPLIYKLFLDSYCKDGKQTFCFFMFTKLFQCLQAAIPLKAEGRELSSSSCSMGLLALEQMLTLVLNHDIYNVAEDRIRHQQVQYKFFCEIAGTLVSNPCISSPSWFRCFNNLLLLNHLIVEPVLYDLLSCAWVDAHISDMRVRKAQESLISSLLQTYVKLRQFPKLFQELLAVICHPESEELRQPVLTSGLDEKLADQLVQLPPNQILDAWAMILEKCGSVLLADIKKDSSVCLKLVTLSSILNCVLFNMKSLDNNTPVPVLVRFHSLMKQMMDELILPSLNLIKQHSAAKMPLAWLQKLCDAALLFLYTWVEVNVVTKLNCSKYVSQIGDLSLHLETSVEGWDFSIFCEDKDCWRKIYKHCLRSNLVSVFYLELLCIQKIKYILIHVDIPTKSIQQSLYEAASLIVHRVTNLPESNNHTPWSGNNNIVDTNSFHVAHWHLVASNLIIILPYISVDDVNNITDIIVETKCPASYSKKQANKDRSVSFGEISLALLKSDHFPELPVLQCALVTSIIGKCAKVLKEKNVLAQICGLLSDRDLLWHEDFLTSYSKGARITATLTADSSSSKSSVCVTNLENVVQSILSLMEEKRFVDLGDSEVISLINVIEFIFELKPDSLTASDQCRCFLLLLSIACSTSLRSLHLACTCYRLMMHLMNGKHSKSLFKLIFASDLLKTVMISLQQAHMEFPGEGENTHYWSEFVSVIQSFFDTLFALIMERKQSRLLNLEKFAEFVFQYFTNPDSRDWNSYVGQLLIAVLNSLCRVLTSCIRDQFADVQRTANFCDLLQQSVVNMNAVVEHFLKVSTPSQLLPSFLVSCMTTLLEAELSCKDGVRGQRTELYRSFCSQILRELPYAEKQTAFLKAAFQHLAVCIPVDEICNPHQILLTTIFSSVKKLFAGPWINKEVIESVEIDLKHLFKQLIEHLSSEDFNTVLQSTLQGLKVANLWQNRNKEIFAAITIIKLLLNSSLTEDKGKVFWFTASQIMTALVTLGYEACKDRLLLSKIIVPVLHTMALLLRRGEMFLMNPHHVTLSFSTLLTVPLDHLRAGEYYSIFLAIHEVLFSILQCHSKAMLKSVATFLSAFHRLVGSVMHEGQQKGDKGTSHDLEIILKCASLVERMYTHIASKTAEFTVFSAFMVAQFVNELQKVTLQPVMKKHLTSGICHILDLCIDRDIKFLNSSLQVGGREVFKELYLDYTHHHKTRNQGEEKYTV
ncbi:unhealthy ribosome biogenesis protein 2 homolog [Hyperolius riggenbachi]|uniref:unhealthy ribosome biogenesis protein 2 homolog n=1 Tax=Hyperolius riggenbachi TaxID=752182 RepID=UPI0035A269D7